MNWKKYSRTVSEADFLLRCMICAWLAAGSQAGGRLMKSNSVARCDVDYIRADIAGNVIFEESARVVALADFF